MSAVRLQAGPDVLSGLVDVPRVGLWTADVELDTATPPAIGDSVTLELVAASGDTIGYRGVVRLSDAYTAELSARARIFVVGGAGGLGKTVAAQHYNTTPTARLLVEDVLQAAGEALSSTVDAALLQTTTIASWMRVEATGAAALGRIAAAFGWTWRVLPDGTIWVGVESWREHTGPAPYDHGGGDGASLVSTLSDGELLVPGVTLQGRQVWRVVHRVDGETVRAEVTFGRAPRDDWDAAVRAAVPELACLGRYGARVLGQNGDGTLEVQCDDARLGGLSRVPMRLGLPGASADVQTGARVRVAFEGADPSLAYAELWDASAPVDQVRLDGTASYAGKAVARIDDHVACGQLGFVLAAAPAPPYAAGSYILTIRYSDANALVDLMTILLPPGTQPILPVDGTKTFTLLGKITEGNAEVLA